MILLVSQSLKSSIINKILFHGRNKKSIIFYTFQDVVILVRRTQKGRNFYRDVFLWYLKFHFYTNSIQFFDILKQEIILIMGLG